MAAFVVTGIVVTTVSCTGPERAPHRPIQGIDNPHARGTNPHDIVSAPKSGPLLDDFVDQVSSVHTAAGGTIAVLPALTWNADIGVNHVNGLGEHLAKKTVLDLEKKGIQALSGSDLVLEMQRANLSVKYYDQIADAVEIAKRIGAQFVVTGTVSHKVFNSQQRDEELEIDWVCRKVADGANVARYRVVLPGGALAEELIRHFGQGSEWDRAVRTEKLPVGAGNN